MKKIVAILLAVIAILAMGGCMGAPAAKTFDAYKNDTFSSKIADNSNDIFGLCKYLSAKGLFYYDYKASADEAGECTIKMSAALIGADKGLKASYKYGDKAYIVEIYEYKDTDNQWYKQAKEEGKIQVGQWDNDTDGVFNVDFISNGGRFLVVIHAADKDGDKLVSSLKKEINAFEAAFASSADEA